MVAGVRLTPRIAVVGGGRTGLGISHPVDPNVYLLDGGGELALIDAGVGLGDDVILENVRSLGCDVARIRHVFVTHAHADHVGGVAALADRLGARIYLSQVERPAVESGDEVAIGLEKARRNGVYPPNYRLRPSTVDVALKGGEQLRCGDLMVKVIATPGHSAGSVCYLVDTEDGRALFTGDTVFHEGRISLLVAPGSDLLAMADSITSLAHLGVDALLPGHGLFCLYGGQEHIDLAIRSFDTLLPPAAR